MKIIKVIFKIVIRIIKFVLFLPILLMQPKYKYDVDELSKEMNDIIK